MGKEKREGKHKGKKAYIAGAVILAVLMFTAFFMPQIVFNMQDSLRCQDSQFAMQEIQDITLLSTSYEASLYNRLLRFAEDIQKGSQIYVTSQEMTPNQELDDFLQSDVGLYQDGVMMWMDEGVLSYSFSYDSQVTAWKQYVIYSDNYARGVNFIIWYVEMENKEGSVCRLLMDAQTGSVYGIQTDYKNLMEWSDSGLNAESAEFSEFLGELGFALQSPEAWMAFVYYYGGYREKTGLLEELEIKMKDDISGFAGYVKTSDEEEWIEYTFPYEEYSIDFRIKLGNNGSYNEQFGITFIDFTFGFPDIYELIPEFADSEAEEDD